MYGTNCWTSQHLYIILYNMCINNNDEYIVPYKYTAPVCMGVSRMYIHRMLIPLVK